jgi:hypothetical protein
MIEALRNVLVLSYNNLMGYGLMAHEVNDNSMPMLYAHVTRSRAEYKEALGLPSSNDDYIYERRAGKIASCEAWLKMYDVWAQVQNEGQATITVTKTPA